MAIYTISEVATLLGTDAWRVRRCFELGILPEPRRFAGNRVITPDMIPLIVDALRERGWLSRTPVSSLPSVQM